MSVLTEAELANQALMHLGVDGLVSALPGNTREGRAIFAVWNLARRTTLERYPWGFARGEATLSPLDLAVPQPWAYAFELPPDCLRVRYLSQGVMHPTEANRMPHEQRLAPDGKTVLLYALQAPVELVYTRDVEAIAAWPADFADAFTWGLAYRVGYALKKTTAERDAAYNGFLAAVLAARATDAASETRGQDPAGPRSSFTDAR